MICVRFQPAYRHDRLLSYHYCLADCQVGSDALIDALEPFRVGDVHADALVVAPVRPDAWREVFADSGWIAGEERHVVCRRSGTSYQLDITGVARFEISTGDPALIQVQPDDLAAPSLVEEALLGPALNLALAWRGVWCLHAGAVLHNAQMVIFLGESGSGKSTLAASLAGLDERSWQPGADDILPVTLSSTRLYALPHFPQFKLPIDEQPSLWAPERVPVGAIYLLSDADTDRPVEIRRLSPREGALALVRHTVAARLFDGPLLAAHLSAGMEAARQVRVSELTYTRRFDILPRVAEFLKADLHSIEEPNQSS